MRTTSRSHRTSCIYVVPKYNTRIQQTTVIIINSDGVQKFPKHNVGREEKVCLTWRAGGPEPCTSCRSRARRPRCFSAGRARKISLQQVVAARNSFAVALLRNSGAGFVEQVG